MDENRGLTLGDIINERKAERRLQAQEQRRIDLQRVRDMKSTTGIDPLQQFSKEIWMKIIEELNAEGRHTLWQIHPLFRNLMGKNRVRDILLPLVLKVDKFHYWVDYYNGHEGHGLKYDRFRCVSKTIRNSFDHWMDANHIKLIHGETVENYFGIQLLFDKRERLEKLLALVDGGKSFRLFRRGLQIHVIDDPDGSENDLEIITQFINKITTLLEYIGDQIWLSSILLDDLRLEDFAFRQVYTLLRGWITLLPNLKWLDINVDCFYPRHLNLRKRMAIAEECIRNHPFPPLPLLEKITIALNHCPYKKELSQMYKAVLEANQHVKILDIRGDPLGMDSFQSHLQLLPVDLIKSLPLIDFSVRGKKLSFTGLQYFVNLDWKLNSITLKLEKSSGLSVSSLFRFLEHFSTLENVTLELPKRIKIGERNRNEFGFLALPNLAKFTIYISQPEINYNSNFHFFFSLHFLLQCKKLKMLNWTIHDFDDVMLRKHLDRSECRWTMLDFRGGLRFLYESNIWNVFPSLETVRVEFLKENADESEKCEQEYQRGARGEGFSVGEFLKNHCCCEENRLQDCAILFG